MITHSYGVKVKQEGFQEEKGQLLISVPSSGPLKCTVRASDEYEFEERVLHRALLGKEVRIKREVEKVVEVGGNVNQNSFLCERDVCMIDLEEVNKLRKKILPILNDRRAGKLGTKGGKAFYHQEEEVEDLSHMSQKT